MLELIFLTISACVREGANSAYQAVDSKPANPASCSVAMSTSLSDRLLPVTASALNLARLHQGQIARDEPEAEIDLAAQEVIDQRGCTSIRHVCHLDPCCHLQQLGGHVTDR